MNIDRAEIVQEIENICSRPGMYFGSLGEFEISNNYEQFVIYINGYLLGISLSSNMGLSTWRTWVQTRYDNRFDPTWEKILLDQFKTPEGVLKNFPVIFKEYANDENDS